MRTDKADIPKYPDAAPPAMGMRALLHPLFQRHRSGVSEFTFANIYLFRESHGYKVSSLEGGLHAITGSDAGERFFMLPFGLPPEAALCVLFEDFSRMKCVDELTAGRLASLGYSVEEDRDNFDYLYSRAELCALSGRKFHRKKNLVNYFEGHYAYEARPLLDELVADALLVLERWREERAEEGDYRAAREALENCARLQLCGGIYYVDGAPAAYTLGEELAPDVFVIHFEKGVGEYKGLMQFVNQSFASILPDKYMFINREQDLGDEGLRQAKLSYRPSGFVKKFRACLP